MAAANGSRFHTGRNGARFAPSHEPAITDHRRVRDGAAFSKRVRIAFCSHNDDGTPPRLSVVSGNTETSTGVTASNPHSSTTRHSRSASSAVARGKPGNDTSLGTLTRHGKSAPARSAT